MGLFEIQKDIKYVESLRSKAIGFEMQAFYDSMLEGLRDAHFRSLMAQEYQFEHHRF